MRQKAVKIVAEIVRRTRVMRGAMKGVQTIVVVRRLSLVNERKRKTERGTTPQERAREPEVAREQGSCKAPGEIDASAEIETGRRRAPAEIKPPTEVATGFEKDWT